jgi:malate dehydrogenase (oxaloacetate-decarboxylating)
LNCRNKLRGKIEIESKVSASTPKETTISYTSKVAEVCLEITADSQKAYEYRSKLNNIAIVTDGTRALGLGRLGREAALPVEEGKVVLYKQFVNGDAIPIFLQTTTAEETQDYNSPVFGGINIEDFETPKALEIMDRLADEIER